MLVQGLHLLVEVSSAFTTCQQVNSALDVDVDVNGTVQFMRCSVVMKGSRLRIENLPQAGVTGLQTILPLEEVEIIVETGPGTYIAIVGTECYRSQILTFILIFYCCIVRLQWKILPWAAARISSNPGTGCRASTGSTRLGILTTRSRSESIVRKGGRTFSAGANTTPAIVLV